MARTKTPSSVAQLVADEFSATVRRRGDRYYENGAVVECRGDARCMAATVQGSLPYEVTIAFDEDEPCLEVWCTCPYWEDRLSPCKHLWATVLEADQRGWLADAVDEDDCIIVPDSAMLDQIDGAVVDGDGGWNPFTIDSPVRTQSRRPGPRRGGVRRARTWPDDLDAISRAISRERDRGDSDSALRGADLAYVIDVRTTMADGLLAVDIGHRHRRADGEWGGFRPRRIPCRLIDALPVPDRRLLALVASMTGAADSWRYSHYGDTVPSRADIAPGAQVTLVRLMCETGRAALRSRDAGNDLVPLAWDDGEPWKLTIEVRAAGDAKAYRLAGLLSRGQERMRLDEPLLLTAGGLVFMPGRVAQLDHGDAFPWIVGLRGATGGLEVPVEDGDKLLARLLAMPAGPALDLPEPLRFEEVDIEPAPRLRVRATNDRGPRDRLSGELSFDYAGTVIAADDARDGLFDASSRRLLRRHERAECAAMELLREIGFTAPPVYRRTRPTEIEIARPRLARAVRELTAHGWWVEAEGRVLRRASAFRVEVKSGVDWFELHGAADFGDHAATLPELLAALRKDVDAVRLDDGTYGVLPEEWLRRFAPIAGLGEVEDGHVRFRSNQAGLLDALLAARPEVSCDDLFAKARSKLAKFDRIRPRRATAGFRGTLREYQREGLGWLHFLREFGFGGCLADDMGLGKTVQVLALLESRRLRRRRAAKGDANAPSLVVVPRSLVHHWKHEAERFAPKLRVHDHTGPDRLRGLEASSRESLAHFNQHDLIVTTYGTLRRDAEALSRFRFDYAILDEAQAIKNADTVSAKAARLLVADHRLTLSGTPIENDVSDLLSLFAFLQPGLLGPEGSGSARALGANPDEDTRRIVAGAVRPFILRRKKEQVARDLPPKLEQDLDCELGPKQRRQYDELRDHYRSSLLRRVDRQGLRRSKMHVLEALLRLRQVACHPGLVDPQYMAAPSAKLEVLSAQLSVAIEEGHKALVFSQFTKLLAIVRRELDRQGVQYEYLDGRTRKRAEKIERFQSDVGCQAFLISLKAGGTGLNLTAADYVFLLDPWWNPAVEAQAIDRTHRIGQTRHVFAYRLIARDTVEERIRELQERKKDLAEAIIGGGGSLLRDLRREDLEALLS